MLVTVTVMDVNDNRPTFTQSVYRGTVCGSALTGSLVSMDSAPISVIDHDQVNHTHTHTHTQTDSIIAPQYLTDGCQPAFNVVSVRSASRRLLQVPRYRPRVTFARWAFTVADPSVWNLLADYPAVGMDTFRKHFKTFYSHVTNACSALAVSR